MTTQKRTPKTVLATLLATLAVIACIGGFAWFAGGGPQQPGSDPAGADATQPAATQTVEDMAGRQVEIPAEPRHIAALDSFSGEVCVLAGAGERLFGAPGGVISNQLLAQVYPGLADIERLSGNSVNAETLMAGGVDAVLVKSDLYTGSTETEKLERLGIPFVVVGYGTVEEQMKAIRLVGKVCGGEASERADAIADYYEQTAKLVEERAAQVPASERARVYHSVNGALTCDGAGSLGEDWIARTGAVSVSAQESPTGNSGDYEATLEQVYSWDPDLVICSSAAAAREFQTEARWSGLGAVAQGRVRVLPVSSSRWGQRGDPETFLAMLWLGKELYPELYEDIDLKETVTSYYRDIIGLEIDDETWEQILAGEGLRAQGSGNGGN